MIAQHTPASGIDLTTYRLLKQHSPEILEKMLSLGEISRWRDCFKTRDSRMLKMKEEATMLSFVNDPVLISGPSGTGKEILAHILHGNRKGPFIAINCAGLPEALMESELFGFVKGAFTGSISPKEGLLTAARDGSIFLDEIGELPMVLQPKLLRAIQEMTIRKVGGNLEETINCRFIFATHRNLQRMCKEYVPRFRDDLYYRISTFELETIPLEERTADIAYILKALDVENKIEDMEQFLEGINPQRLDGNVRTLQKLIRRYYVLGELPNLM